LAEICDKFRAIELINISMKRKLFLLLPLPTVALILLAGCQADSNYSTPHTTAPAATPVAVPATTPAPATPPPPVVVTPPAPAKSPLPTIRINAGSGALKDSTGVEWLAETGFEGGDVVERPDLPIANTKQPEIYRSEHYAMDAFKQPLPNGKYLVKLHFAETFEGIQGPGGRVFSFDVEGKAFADFDPFAKAGGFGKAYVESVPVDIADGVLNIKFTPQVENPQICGIEIVPAP
jgi:hypothetical protein